MIAKLIYILIINLITFGGGPVYIPMYEQFYKTFNIANTNEYYAIVSIMNGFPGVTGGKLQGYAMYSTNGILGIILGSIFFIVPGIIIMKLALKYLSSLKNSKYFKSINKYTNPVIIGILIAITIQFIYQGFSNIGITKFVFYSILIIFLLYKNLSVYKVIYITLILSTAFYLLGHYAII